VITLVVTVSTLAKSLQVICCTPQLRGCAPLILKLVSILPLRTSVAHRQSRHWYRRVVRRRFTMDDKKGVNTHPLLHVRSSRGLLGTLLGVLRPQGVFIFIGVSCFRFIFFFSISSKKFRLNDTLTAKIEKKVKMGEKKYFERVVLCSYTIGTPGHFCLLQLVPIWLRSKP
jgi:hypothetical protein